MSFQNFINLKISITTVILWFVGILSTVATVSSLYGKQNQRMDAIEERQARVERFLERIDGATQRLDITIHRLEGEWKGRSFPPPSKEGK
jgi:hypothetical protein